MNPDTQEAPRNPFDQDLDRVAERLKEQKAEERHAKTIAKLQGYFENGNMPYDFFQILPKKIQADYKRKFKGRHDHVEGRPMTVEERATKRKHKQKKQKKNKAAKQARKRNR